MEIRRGLLDVATWPLTTALNMGGFVLDVTGLNDKSIRLFDEEPVSRTENALSSADHAAHKPRPDQVLARFEILRAANGVHDLQERNPEAASQLGNKVIAAAFEAALEQGDDEQEHNPTETLPDARPKKPERPFIPPQRNPSE